MISRLFMIAKPVYTLGLVAAMAFGALSASADTLLVSENGVWGADAPTTTWSAPGQSWSYSFLTSSTPAVSNVIVNYYGQPGVSCFDGAFSDFTYTLNGDSVSVVPSELTWFSAGFGGLLNLNFTGPMDASLEFSGAQAYSGPESAPTIIPGVYELNSPASMVFFWSPTTNTTYQYLSGNLVIEDESVPPVPEPSCFLLLGTGLIGLATLAGRKIFA